MTNAKLIKMQQQCLKYKAAQILNKPESKIKSVVEHDNGCTVTFKSASGIQPWINIPHQVWVLGESA
jgi:hypothetical protein